MNGIYDRYDLSITKNIWKVLNHKCVNLPIFFPILLHTKVLRYKLSKNDLVKPLNTPEYSLLNPSIRYCCDYPRDFRGSLKWFLMMPRDDSLSESYYVSPLLFFQAGIYALLLIGSLFTPPTCKKLI